MAYTFFLIIEWTTNENTEARLQKYYEVE